ncbi:hypothetical protein HDR60_01650 [bacterium]|nr:hypothetical protein [bacterium]
MQSFIIPNEIIPFINLYSLKNDKDDFSMIRLCKTAIEKNFSSITVDMEQLENVWKWVETSNIKLCGSVNMIQNTMSPTVLFKSIKSVFENGADMAEVIMPLEFSNINEEQIPTIMLEYLNVIEEAKNNRVAKVCMETGYITYLSQIKLIIGLMQKYNIDIIKTASSFYKNAFSNLNHLNSILDNVNNINTKIDFLFDVKNSNKFIIDNAFRLLKKSRISLENPLIISYPIEFL